MNKFHYLNGGSEKYYFELGELLKEHGHEVAYFSMKNEKNIKTGDKVKDMREKAIRNLRRQVVRMCDVLIDGRYVDELRDISLHWRGSSNQRVINVQETLKQNQIVLWES